MLLSLFHAFIGHSYIWWSVCSNHLSIFNCFVCPIIIIELERVFLYSGYKSFTRYMYCEYFLPVCALSFPFLNNVLQRAEGFNFNEVQFIFLPHFFMVHALSVLVKNCSLPQYYNNFTLRKHEKIVITLGSMI